MAILGLYHAGIRSPLHVCKLASLASVTGNRVMFLQARLFRPYLREVKGVIDVTYGVTVVYSGREHDPGQMIYQVMDYIRSNRNRLAELWANHATDGVG